MKSKTQRDNEAIRISMYKKTIEDLVKLEFEYEQDGSCAPEAEACKEMAAILSEKLGKLIVARSKK